MRPLESALLRRADCIVATSQVHADGSETLAPFKSKITVVPIGVPDAKHKKQNALAPPSLENKIINRKVILAVGRLVPYKGFDVLIEAAKDLTPRAVVVIVGGGPLEQELQKAIEDTGVGDRVVLAGRLNDAALHALFQRATLYCLPSTSRLEAFGVVLLEAMTYGLPIVATDIPGSGVPWVNQHGTSGLNVPVGNPAALAKACNQILDSEKLHQKLATGAKLRFLSTFREEISVRRMNSVYEAVSTAKKSLRHVGRFSRESLPTTSRCNNQAQDRGNPDDATGIVPTSRYSAAHSDSIQK